VITCDKFVARISDYLDDRVPMGERIGLCMHRLLCIRCRNFYRQLKEIVAFVEEFGNAPKIKPSEAERQQLVEHFRDRYGTTRT